MGVLCDALGDGLVPIIPMGLKKITSQLMSLWHSSYMHIAHSFSLML